MTSWMARRIIKKWGKVLPLAVALVAVILVSHHRPPQPRIGALIGVWTSDNPAYAARRLEIHKDVIVVAFDNDSVYTESIGDIEAQPHGRRTTYTIHTVSFGTPYQPEDEHPAQWILDYDPANGGSFRFEHQPNVVWKRAVSAGH